MNERLYAHYLSTGIYTNPGVYADYFRTLPDNIADLGKLICDQIVHPTVLMFPNPYLEKYFGSLSQNTQLNESKMKMKYSLQLRLWRLSYFD